MPLTLTKLKEKAGNLGLLFHLCVTTPTLLATLYFSLFASDVYISESRFVVRSPNKPQTTGFGELLKTVGFSNSGDEIFAANDYLESRDALKELNEHGQVVKSYGNYGVSIFNRFDPIGFNSSFEDLYKYFSEKVSIEYDSSTSITTLDVRAYNAKDARQFNEAMLQQAEGVVNRLNVRARNDLLDNAKSEVEKARLEAIQAAQQLAAYRDKSGVIDPDKQATVQLQMVSKLQDELISSRIQLDNVRKLASQSSEIPALQAQIAGLEASIETEMQRAAGGPNSLSKTAIEYQRLLFDDQFAQKKLTATLASYEEARLDVLHKQSYVERIVQPNLPDKAQEPYRVRGVFAAFAMGLIAWGILSMLLASLKDHVE